MQIYIKMCLFRLLCKNYIKVKCVCVCVCVCVCMKQARKRERWRLTQTACMLSCSVVSDSSPPGFSVHWIFQGKNTGKVYHFLIQEVFLIQGSNPHFPSSVFAGGSFITEPSGKPKCATNCSGLRIR